MKTKPAKESGKPSRVEELSGDDRAALSPQAIKQSGRSGHAKFSNIRRENGRRRINTTFAVQFIKRHCCRL